MTTLRLGRLELPHPTRPAVAAADRDKDALFAARAALRRAQTLSHGAALQVDQMRTLVGALERSDRELREQALQRLLEAKTTT